MNDVNDVNDVNIASEPVANGTGPGLPVVETRLQDLDSRVRTFVSERPAVALVTAVACGFLVGRLLSR